MTLSIEALRLHFMACILFPEGQWAVKQDGPVLVGFESLWLAEENHPATILWYIEFCSLY